ncbi:HAMP domain-containing histidine kinase [Sulfurimonas sp. SWIR-19]|uniref:sensor histidine kinase n=1 Tax=Sulfurimonas sp. SWIR-19 TaxID=2878390 RepID=UPI001CF5CB7A|nr:HAMP domain-containing sensor histidine kinase [Sulfurimonas sp. SWIR-19]UCN00361.1 HAMP domain-containing histidine kinase [Sulfurimonas sp. SWIR-19]
MKKVEKESLLKSFFLFFLSQTLLAGALFLLNYQKELQSLDETVFSKMRLCSFSLQCKEFQYDFVPKKEYELYRLYKNKSELSAYFSIPNSTKNALKIYLPKEKYMQEVRTLQKELLWNFFIVVFVIAILSFFFALYALSPLRKALHVTEEFIKDILHDFNTPLSTLRLNVSMLKSETGENTKIERIENAVQNILNLQSNLRAYLHSHVTQKEEVVLKEFLQERINLIESNYRDIHFYIEVPHLVLHVNKDSFMRIIDNLISNAAKYNKKEGKVFVRFSDDILSIEDTGKGIRNPKRVFERFYKEQERGIGIGLHIVKKLCEESDIAVSVQSEVGKGTVFTLNLKNIIV